MEKKKWIAVWCILAVLVVGMGASITLSAVMFNKVSGLKTSVDSTLQKMRMWHRKMMLLLLTNTQLNQQKIFLMHIKKEEKIL